MKGWLLLLAAILLENCGTICVKLAEGFSRPLPSLLLFVFYGLSFTLFTYAVKTIEVSIAYAVWSGVGTASIALIGLVFFRESAGFWKIFFIVLIIAGAMGLNLVEKKGG
ncbi:MAG: multidrug efflux SMR transporter [Thermodesulfobacteriota bacterium]